MRIAASLHGMATIGPLPDSWPPELTPPPAAMLAGRGVQAIDRESLLFASAGVHAAERAGIQNGADVGVVCGTHTAGHANYRRILAGLRGAEGSLRPSWGPRSSFNAPAAELSMRTGATGPALTVTSGEAAGLDAILMARDLIATGQAQVVLAGGVDVLDGAGGYGAAVVVLVDADVAACPAPRRLEGAATAIAVGSPTPESFANAAARAVHGALTDANRPACEVTMTITAATTAPASRDALAISLSEVSGLGSRRLALDDLPGMARGAGGALCALAGMLADRSVTLVVAVEGDGRALALVIGPDVP